jgi:uncharacterized protein (DUF433 family)
MDTLEVRTNYPHIVIKDGVAFISGTTFKVTQLLQTQETHGYSAEELHFQFPTLGMGKIHSALAYYWDNKRKLDAQMQARHERAVGVLAGLEPPRFLERLRQAKQVG